MKKVSQIIDDIKFKNRPKNLSREFQFYGCSLAEKLDDTKNYSLYIKLAKDTNRSLLELSLNFAKDYPSAKSRAKLFMWKLKKLKDSKNT